MLNKKHFLKSQKGAMFGLDARVALAIFGGLSIIAGTAVFSSIRETNVTSLLAEFDNISKGYINFTFDTGVDIPMGGAGTEGFINLYTDANGTLGWRGPYITRSTDEHPVYGAYELTEARIANDTTPSAWTPTAPTGCSGALVAPDEICGAWLDLTEVPCEIAKELDERIDGVIDGDSGNFRLDDGCTDGTTVEISYLLSRKSA